MREVSARRDLRVNWKMTGMAKGPTHLEILVKKYRVWRVIECSSIPVMVESRFEG